MIHDFLIIGGGIAGISVAARLSHLGTVQLLEAEPALAYHASGRSAALFEENYGAPTVVALNKASREHLQSANGGVLSPRGILMVGMAGQEDQHARESAAFQMDPISVDEAVDMVPIFNRQVLTKAALSRNALDIDTDLLIQNFARECRANGGLLQTNARVTEIEKTGQGWQVKAGDTVYEGRMLVNAAGAWVDQIATLAGINPIGFQPYRRSVARIPAPGNHDLRDWPMLFGVNEAWYAKPDAGQLIISPSEEHPMDPHDAFADDMVLAEGIARFSETVTTEVTRVTANWAGLRTFAPDRTLVIGPDPNDSSFFWQAGQGGYGFQTSAGASRLAAELIGGTPTTLDAATVAALSPRRFL